MPFVPNYPNHMRSSMKKTIVGVFILVCIGGMAAALARNLHHIRREKQSAIIARSTKLAETAADSFAVSCSLARAGMGTHGLRVEYERMRSAYKACELLIEYLDPHTVTSYLNGAPLPKLDPKSTFIEELEPEGLQVIDELLYGHEKLDDETIRTVQDKSVRFASSIRQAMMLVRNAPWTDRMILECLRTGVLRLTTMGITGFDRPASEPTLEDNDPLLRTMCELLETYEPWSSSASDGRALRASLSCIHRAQTMLRSSFDGLDRAELIRTCLDPLYKNVVTLHTQLGVEFGDEIGSGQVVLNPRAESMFHHSVFNAAATTGLAATTLSPQMVELGRLLFFDPALSESNERSCASCHRPEKAFTDGLPTSTALGRKRSIQRNAPTLINSVFARRFFYDLRAMRLNDVVAHVVTHKDEFGSSLIDMVTRLRASSRYQLMFESAFRMKGAEAIDATHVGLAIGSYVASLSSFDSRIDRYLRGEAVRVSPSERRGLNLFMGRAACATCHFAPTFAGYVPPTFVESESEILGVPARFDTVNAVPDTDIGRAAGIRREYSRIYRHSFKTPTIRNVALTAPYFHNGSYRTLEQVIDFYARGGGKGIGWPVPHQTLPFDKLELNGRDRRDLVAFMKSLTDTVGLTSRPMDLPFISTTPGKRLVGGAY